MKEHVMKREAKDAIVGLGLKASAAFKTYNTALAELVKNKTAEAVAAMDPLLKAKTDTFQALVDAVTNLNADMTRELGSQALYWFLHKPLFPKGGGEMGWDLDRGYEIVDAMKSIQSAMEGDGGQFKGDRNRIHLMRYQVLKASAVVTLCRETGIVPRNGLTAGLVEVGLQKLEAKQNELYQAGDQKWEGISKQYKFIAGALNGVLKSKREDRPQSRPTQQTSGTFTAEQSLPPNTSEELKKRTVDNPRPNRKGGKRGQSRP